MSGATRVNQNINWVTDDSGNVVGYQRIPGDIILFPTGDAQGNQSVAGNLTVVGRSLTETGVGAVAEGVAATVTVQERGNDFFHQTVLTLANVPVEIVSVGAGIGVGGTELYAFPAGMIGFQGCMADLSIAVAAAKQADFTDATPEGKIGIGTVAPANDDALGTDASDDDLGTAAAFTMTAFADSEVTVSTEAAAHLDGTSAQVKVFLNVAVDAADIDNDVTTEVLVSGTVRLTSLLL